MSPIPYVAKDDPKLPIHFSSAGGRSVSYHVKFLSKYPTHWVISVTPDFVEGFALFFLLLLFCYVLSVFEIGPHYVTLAGL